MTSGGAYAERPTCTSGVISWAACTYARAHAQSLLSHARDDRARPPPLPRPPHCHTRVYPPSKTRLSVCCKQLSHTLAHCGRRVCALASPSPFLAPSLTFFLPRCPLSARSTRGQPLPASPSTTMADSLHSSSLSPPCRLLRTAGLCRPVAAGYTMFLCRSSVRLPDLLMRPRARTAPRHASCPRSFSSSSLLTSACSFCSKRYVRSPPPPLHGCTHTKEGGGEGEGSDLTCLHE